MASHESDLKLRIELPQLETFFIIFRWFEASLDTNIDSLGGLGSACFGSEKLGTSSACWLFTAWN